MKRTMSVSVKETFFEADQTFYTEYVYDLTGKIRFKH